MARPETIGQALARARRTEGITKAGAAERIGVTVQTIAAWEAGASVPRVDLAVALLRLYEVPEGDWPSLLGLPRGVESGR